MTSPFYEFVKDMSEALTDALTTQLEMLYKQIVETVTKAVTDFNTACAEPVLGVDPPFTYADSYDVIEKFDDLSQEKFVALCTSLCKGNKADEDQDDVSASHCC